MNTDPVNFVPTQSTGLDLSGYTHKDRLELLKINSEVNKLSEELKVFLEKSKLEFQKTSLEIEKLQIERDRAKIEAEAMEIALRKEQRAEEALLSEDLFHSIFYFNDEVSRESVDKCMHFLTYIDRTTPLDKEIEIVFSSPGGRIDSGMVLFDYIRYLVSKGRKITTSVLGEAASMAGILVQAGSKRVMYRQAWFLIHEVSFGAVGKYADVEDKVEWIKRVQSQIIDIFAENSKKAFENGTATQVLSLDELREGFKRKDWWLDAEECLRYGIIDEIR